MQVVCKEALHPRFKSIIINLLYVVPILPTYQSTSSKMVKLHIERSDIFKFLLKNNFENDAVYAFNQIRYLKLNTKIYRNNHFMNQGCIIFYGNGYILSR